MQFCAQIKYILYTGYSPHIGQQIEPSEAAGGYVGLFHCLQQYNVVTGACYSSCHHKPWSEAMRSIFFHYLKMILIRAANRLCGQL